MRSVVKTEELDIYTYSGLSRFLIVCKNLIVDEI
jgi:hypothetical protein